MLSNSSNETSQEKNVNQIKSRCWNKAESYKQIPGCQSEKDKENH